MNKVVLFLLLCLTAFTTGTTYAQQQIITTYAGNATLGYSGDWGYATSAKLSNPVGVALDKWGNLYIAEQGNSVVRKVTPGSVISTAAGDGSIGYIGDGAAAIVARLNAPGGVAVDTSGNIFIADGGNCVIRKVTAGGIISTIAGNDSSGCGYAGDGGPAAAAKLNIPNGIIIDQAGNLLFADQGNEVIRKINTSGVITTIAGNDSTGFSGDGGPATDAELNLPFQLALDGLGNVYFADANNGRIRRIDQVTGIITTVAGAGITGSFGEGVPATSARLVTPTGVAFDGQGNMYISDLGLNQIRKVNTAGNITTIAGSGATGYGGDGGPASACKFNQPFGITVDGNGNIYVADRNNNVVRKISIATSAVAPVSTTNNNINLFPNPNTGIFVIKGTLNSVANESVSLEVMNMLGQVVYKNSIVSQQGYINAQINPDGSIADGMYLLHISSASENEVLRFVIEK